MEFSYYVTSFTHAGMTKENSEDSCLVEVGENGTAVIAVADGMGGMKASQIASSIAIEYARDFFHSDSFKRLNMVHNDTSVMAALKRLFSRVNGSIIKAGESLGQKLSTTLTTGFVLSRRIYLGHLGNSHAFRIRNGIIECLTTEKDKDVAEIVKRRNFLGSPTAYDPECLNEMVQDNDTFVFCNDNLFKLLKSKEIMAVVNDSPNLQKACGKLVELAKERAPGENVTAAILTTGAEEIPEEKPEKKAFGFIPENLFEDKKPEKPEKVETIEPLKVPPAAEKLPPPESIELETADDEELMSKIWKYKFPIGIVALAILILTAILAPKMFSGNEGKVIVSPTPVIVAPEVDRATTEVVIVVGALKHLKTLKANNQDLIETIKQKKQFVFPLKEKGSLVCELKPQYSSSLYSVIVRFGDNREISLRDIRRGKNQLIMENGEVKINLLREFQFSSNKLPKGRTQVKIKNLQSPISLKLEGDPINIKVKRK